MTTTERTQSDPPRRGGSGKPEGDPEPGAGAVEFAVRAVLRHARAVSLVALASTFAAALYAAATLRIDSDTDSLFARDLPFQVHSRNLEASFPADRRQLVILLEGDSPAAAHRAASALADGLAADIAHFKNVYAPGSGAFFDRQGLLYLDVEDLDELTDRLAWAQPFLGELALDPSLPRLLRMLEEVVSRAPLRDVPEAELAETLELVAASLADGGTPFAWERWAAGGIDLRREFRLVYAEPHLDFETRRPTTAAIERIRELARTLEVDDAHGVRLRITGDLALAEEELATLRRQGVLLASLSFAGISMLLMLGLGSVRYATAALATLGVGLAWTAAFAAATVGRLNLLSVSFAVLFIGLGVDFAIHFATRLIAAGRDQPHPEDAMVQAARASAGPLALCAATTAIAFYSFLPTDYRGIAELGWIAGSGMFFSLAATLLVFPAFAWSLGRDPTKPASSLSLEAGALGRRAPKTVVAIAGLLVLAALPALRGLRFDPDPIKLRDPHSESVEAFRQLAEHAGASLWTAEFAARDLATARDHAHALEALPEVEAVLHLDRFVPADQDEKLARISDLALLLGDLSPREPAPIDPEEAERALRDLGIAVDSWLREGATDALSRALHPLLEATDQLLQEFSVSTDSYRDVARLQQRMMGDLPEWLERLATALEAQAFTRDDLPEALRARYLGVDGALRIQVFAAQDLRAPGAMAAFADAVRSIVPGASGSAVRIVEAGRTVTRALAHASLFALLAVTVLLLAVWRRPLRVAGLLALVGLAALLTAASSRWFGVPINFADVIVLPLLVGIGVDSAVHLLHRDAGAATDRGVMLSGLTTLASFGFLAFSSHPGLASLGRLLVLGIAWLLLVNLVLLPALRGFGARRHSGQTH